MRQAKPISWVSPAIIFIVAALLPTLGGCAPSYYKRLEALATSEDASHRANAAKALARAGNYPAIAPLARALRVETGPNCAKVIATALGTIGGPAIDTLLACLESHRTLVHDAAITGLGKSGDCRAVRPLIHTYGEDLVHPRINSESWLFDLALQRISAPCIDSLLSILEQDLSVSTPRRFESALESNALLSAIGMTESSQAVDPLVRYIRALAARGSDSFLSSACALRRVGGSGVDSLISLLEGPQALRGARSMTDTQVQKDLIKALVGSYSQQPADRGLHVSVMGGAPPETSVRLVLARIFRDPSRSTGVRLEALQGLGCAEGVDALVDALRDPAPEVRRSAATMLGWSDDSRAETALLDALRSQDLEIVAWGHQFYIRRGIEESRDLLHRALETYGIEFFHQSIFGYQASLPQDLLNCGDAALAGITRAWAEKNKVLIKQPVFGNGPSSPHWGMAKKP